MTNSISFLDFVNSLGLIYICDYNRSSYKVYAHRNFVQFQFITEISVTDAMHNLESVKKQIEMALALFGS